LPNRRLYSPVKNNLSNIASPAALKKLIEQRQKQLSKNYEPKEIVNQRKEMMAMIKSYGDKKLVNAVRSLSNEQFKMLWNYGPFASDTSRGYERAMPQKRMQINSLLLTGDTMPEVKGNIRG